MPSGVQVVTHGGTLLGFHSNWYALPESERGSGDPHQLPIGARSCSALLLRRALIEVLYDGLLRSRRATSLPRRRGASPAQPTRVGG